MRPSVGTPNAELLPPAFLFPLLVFLVLSNATVADVQNDSTEPSWTTVLTPSASPIVESWRQELKPRRPIETPPVSYDFLLNVYCLWYPPEIRNVASRVYA